MKSIVDLSLNQTNETFIDFRTYCYTPKTFTNLTEYFKCYQLIASEKVIISVLELLVAFGAALVNGFNIFCLFVGSTKRTCFDEILVGYCLVNGITGLIDIPFFHVSDIFGYWPFGMSSALVWSTYDNNINWNTAAHMFYASYARLRSLQNPKGYSQEILLKKPFIVMILIWIISIGVWGVIMAIIGDKPYTVIVDFNPFFLTSVLNAPWLLFILGVMIIAIIISMFLFEKAAKDKKKRKKKLNNQSSMMETQSTQLTQASMMASPSKISQFGKHVRGFRLTPEKKFLIIMGSYWVQWTPPCIMVMISPFVYIDPGLYRAIYW
jgi:hypothetical protein